MISGRYTETATSQMLQSVGMTEQNAHLVDNSLSIAGTMGGTSVLQQTRAAALPAFEGSLSALGSAGTIASKGAAAVESTTAKDSLKQIPCTKFSPKIERLEGQISEWLGEGSKFVQNRAGDSVFLSQEGMRKVRFDLKKPVPHKSPHGHIEEFIDSKWHKSGPIYPNNVPHN